MVEVCLAGSSDLAAFKEEMQSISRAQGMDLIDDSANTQKGLESISNPHVTQSMHGPLINMGANRKDGSGFMIGNLGMPANQVVIGFGEGSNPTDAHRFADDVVNKLKQRWRVETVPSGTGAKGMESCP